MRSRGWGASRCLGGHPLIRTRSWDLRRIGRGRDRQRSGHRGCVRGIKIETGGRTIRAEARDTEKERQGKEQRRDRLGDAETQRDEATMRGKDKD